MPRPSGVIENRAGQRDDVGLPGGHNRLGLVKTGDQSHGNDGNSNSGPDSAGQGYLIARPYGNLLSGMETAAGNMNRVAARGFEYRGEGASLFDVPTSFDPVRAGNANADRPVGDRLTHGLEYFKRKPHTVFQRSAIPIVTLIGER